MSMIIREDRIEDAAVLFEAETTTAQTPGLLISQPSELSMEAFERKIVELAAIGRYIVVETDGQVVGHASLDPMRLEAIAHVFRLTIVVHPGFLGRGIGAALMRDLLDWAAQTRRVEKIELLVRATNERAIRLYAKLGFVEEGRLKRRVRLADGSFINDYGMVSCQVTARPFWSQPGQNFRTSRSAWATPYASIRSDQ
jgi:RimJ/RimL family protein N-acetyltransferase